MIKKRRRNLDQGHMCRALFTDFSKAFDCLLHDFLTAEFEAYGFTSKSLKLLNSYLNDRKHRTKINSLYSSFLDLLIGVPWGCIIHSWWPCIQNIYLSIYITFYKYVTFTSYGMKENTLQVL